MKKVFAVLCALMAFSVMGMKAEEASKEAEVLTKNYDLKDFHGLAAGDSFSVNLVQDSEWHVELEYSDFLEKYIDVKVKDGVLRLYLKDVPASVRDSRKYKEDKVLKATVHMPDLNRLYLSGAAKLWQDGKFSVPDQDFRLELSGASSADNLKVDARTARLAISGASKCKSLQGAYEKVKMEVSGAAKCEINAAATDWDVVVSGSGIVEMGGAECNVIDIETSGAAKAKVYVPSAQLRYEGTGASAMNAIDAPTNAANVEISGASSCRIAVKDSLDVEASGASTCRYKAINGSLLHSKFNISRGSKVSEL